MRLAKEKLPLGMPRREPEFYETKYKISFVPSDFKLGFFSNGHKISASF